MSRNEFDPWVKSERHYNALLSQDEVIRFVDYYEQVFGGVYPLRDLGEHCGGGLVQIYWMLMQGNSVETIADKMGYNHRVMQNKVTLIKEFFLNNADFRKTSAVGIGKSSLQRSTLPQSWVETRSNELSVKEKDLAHIIHLWQAGWILILRDRPRCNDFAWAMSTVFGDTYTYSPSLVSAVDYYMCRLGSKLGYEENSSITHWGRHNRALSPFEMTLYLGVRQVGNVQLLAQRLNLSPKTLHFYMESLAHSLGIDIQRESIDLRYDRIKKAEVAPELLYPIYAGGLTFNPSIIDTLEHGNRVGRFVIIDNVIL